MHLVWRPTSEVILMQDGHNVPEVRRKVALVTVGSRGDVQPYVCLARALADRGHEVRLLAPRNGEGMARLVDVPFRANAVKLSR